ncbi:hypothetical protein C404_26835 [Ralstonia sp. AU12-08]|nr:hypothetical protein C404_26835 [Ralstonia sp. AU12-08]
MSKPIRERFPELSLAELHQLAEQNRDNETVTRLLPDERNSQLRELARLIRVHNWA